MLKKLFVLAALGMVSFSCQAQELTSQPSKTAIQATQAKVLETQQQRQTNAMILKQPITYSGFFRDLSKAESKSKLLSLRQPANPAKDLQNVYFDERTNRPKGFVLFALNF